MKEVKLPAGSERVLHASFRAALATILELACDELPHLPPQDSDPARSWAVSRWLGGLQLGLVPVADARMFAWPGPWLARLQPPQGAPRFVVMYGVPSGVVWDPAGDGMVEDHWIQDGFVVAAADIALARPPRTAPPPSITLRSAPASIVATSSPGGSTSTGSSAASS